MKTNKEQNSIYCLIEHLENNPLFCSKIKGHDDTIVECICINKVLAKPNYYGILVVNDIVGAVIINYPVDVVVLK